MLFRSGICREKGRGTVYGHAFGMEKDRRCADRAVRERLDLQRGIPLFREEKEGIADQEKLHGMNIR